MGLDDKNNLREYRVNINCYLLIKLIKLRSRSGPQRLRAVRDTLSIKKMEIFIYSETLNSIWIFLMWKKQTNTKSNFHFIYISDMELM